VNHSVFGLLLHYPLFILYNCGPAAPARVKNRKLARRQLLQRFSVTHLEVQWEMVLKHCTLLFDSICSEDNNFRF